MMKNAKQRRKLAERAGDFFRASLFFGAVTLSSFGIGGCSLTGWTVDKKGFVPLNSRTITRDIGLKKVENMKFDFSDPFLEGKDYKVRVEKSLNETRYHLTGKREEATLEECLWETKKDADVSMIVLSSLAMGAIGASIAEDPAGGFLVGAVLGIGGGSMYTPEKCENRETRTGIRKVELSEERIERKLLGEKQIYRKMPARNTTVWVTRQGPYGFRSYPTNESGVLNISSFSQSFSLFGSERELKERLNEIPLLQQVNPIAFGHIKSLILGEAYKASAEFYLETRENSSETEKVENASKKVQIPGFGIPEDAIYRAVSDFVNKKINSSIASVRIKIRDSGTLIGIRNANIRLAPVGAPSRSELAGEYFTGNLREYAEGNITDYLTASREMQNCNPEESFVLYLPAEVELEVTHPGYNFVRGKIKINKKDTERTVYMVDRGSKVRIDMTPEGQGRIE